MARKASVTSLGGFIRDQSPLNLTESKQLAAEIISRAEVQWIQGQEPALPTFEIGQLWLHRSSDATVRILDIELSPTGPTESAVRYWEPVAITWCQVDLPRVTYQTSPEIFAEQCVLFDGKSALVLN